MGHPDSDEAWVQASGPADVAPAPGEQDVDPDTDPRVAAVVYLLHRRRAWAWTLGASLVALVAVVAVGTILRSGGTGAASVVGGFTLLLLLALAVVALTAVITDTIRLRRREPSVRAHAASRMSYHPKASQFRTPVRHRVIHVVGWVALATCPLLTVLILPDQVNAVAYLAGAGSTVTFRPQSYELVCGRYGCSTWTDGVLQTRPPVRTTWPNQVPLGQPFSVRQPWWNGWGHPDLMNGGAAAAAIAGVLFTELGSVFFAVGLVRMARRRLRLP
jgi:hypothetical protein